VVQLRYNPIYQGAALHALAEARARGLGVAVLRPMTSGRLQRTLRVLKPPGPAAAVYEVALEYVLADSRGHVANVGMRWPREVDQNVDPAEAFRPPPDFAVAGRPRLTAGIYRAAAAAAAAAAAERAQAPPPPPSPPRAP
jgi:predicted aldo/keto reductase-like oxidoreductase